MLLSSVGLAAGFVGGSGQSKHSKHFVSTQTGVKKRVAAVLATFRQSKKNQNVTSLNRYRSLKQQLITLKKKLYRGSQTHVVLSWTQLQ